MEKSAAKKLTIIYGIVAFIVMGVVVVALGGSGTVSGAILFWSFINYTMLTKGQDMRDINEIKKRFDDSPSPAMWLGEQVGEEAGQTTYIVMLCGSEENPQALGMDLPDICRRLELQMLGTVGDGSVVVTAAEMESALRMRVGGMIVETYRRAVTVVIRPSHELEQTLRVCPFREEKVWEEGGGLYLAMAPMMPTYAQIEAVKTAKGKEDEVRNLSRDIYVRTRNGMSEILLAQFTGMGAAVRSWETVNAIVGLAKTDTEPAQENQSDEKPSAGASPKQPADGVAAGLASTTAPEKPANTLNWNIGPEEDKKKRSDKKEKSCDRGDGRIRLRGDENKHRGHDPHKYWRGD
jgi:uncharacterized protein (DUF1697 family)